MDNSCLFIHKVSRWYSRHKQATWNCLGMMSIMPTVDFLGCPITFLVLVPTSFFFFCFLFVFIFFDIPRWFPGLPEDCFPSIFQISKRGVSIWTSEWIQLLHLTTYWYLASRIKEGKKRNKKNKRRKPEQRQSLFQRAREKARGLHLVHLFRSAMVWIESLAVYEYRALIEHMAFGW